MGLRMTKKESAVNSKLLKTTSEKEGDKMEKILRDQLTISQPIPVRQVSKIGLSFEKLSSFSKEAKAS